MKNFGLFEGGLAGRKSRTKVTVVVVWEAGWRNWSVTELPFGPAKMDGMRLSAA
jgi:hypothetical protein